MTKDEIVKSLRACGRRSCGDCPSCKRLDCDTMTFDAADLIEQQTARIAELEAKLPRWIPVEERLPKKGEDGRDCSWVHCIVFVLATRVYSRYDGEAEEYKFIAPAMFDTEQKIWHVGQEEATFDVNALIQPEDTEGDYIGYWMPYPDAPKGAYLP